LYFGLGNSRNPIFGFAFVSFMFLTQGGELDISGDFRDFHFGTSEIYEIFYYQTKYTAKFRLF